MAQSTALCHSYSFSYALFDTQPNSYFYSNIYPLANAFANRHRYRYTTPHQDAVVNR